MMSFDDIPLPLDGLPDPIATGEVDPDLSAGQKLTLRQMADVRRGVHPLTHGPLHPDASTSATRDDPPRQPFTCGSCYHRNPSSEYVYPKCDLGPAARSVHTDVRAWWPACIRYEGGDRWLSADAARSTPAGA
jgi:hypothetical protein